MVFAWWQEIEAVASALERKTTLLGAEIRRIIADAQVRKAEERDRLRGIVRRPLTREEAMARLTPRGRRAVIGTLAADGKTIVEKR